MNSFQPNQGGVLQIHPPGCELRKNAVPQEIFDTLQLSACGTDDSFVSPHFIQFHSHSSQHQSGSRPDFAISGQQNSGYGDFGSFYNEESTKNHSNNFCDQHSSRPWEADDGRCRNIFCGGSNTAAESLSTNVFFGSCHGSDGTSSSNEFMHTNRGHSISDLIPPSFSAVGCQGSSQIVSPQRASTNLISHLSSFQHRESQQLRTLACSLHSGRQEINQHNVVCPSTKVQSCSAKQHDFGQELEGVSDNCHPITEQKFRSAALVTFPNLGRSNEIFEPSCQSPSQESPSGNSGDAVQELEHFRRAFVELSRQNFMLRSRLSAVEQQLAQYSQPHDVSAPEYGADTALPASKLLAPSFWAPGEQTNSDNSEQNACLSRSSLVPSIPVQPAGKPKDPIGGSRKGERQNRFWTRAEHERFLEGVGLFGSQDAHSIAKHVGTRTVIQVRTHAQKHFLKQGRSTNQASVSNVVESSTSPAVPNL